MTVSMDVGMPDEIRVSNQRRRLNLIWPGGRSASVTARCLRAACRCSACRARRQRGDHPDGRDTRIQNVLPAGVAGIQLVFDDGHQRGIFPWDYLASLGEGSE